MLSHVRTRHLSDREWAVLPGVRASAGSMWVRLVTRADLEAAAKEKYPFDITDPNRDHFYQFRRAAYIRGRLDQSEADAQIARGRHDVGWEGHPIMTALYPCDGQSIAAAIRKGVE